MKNEEITAGAGSVAGAATADDGASVLADGKQQCPTADVSYAEKLRARLDYLEDWYFRPQAYETKISQWEVKELREHRPHLWANEEGGMQNAETGTGGDCRQDASSTLPKAGRKSAVFERGDNIETQREMAARLDLHYRGGPNGAKTLKWDISPQAITNWKNNRGLPSNAPVPPGLVPGTRYFSLREWIVWFDKYLWPTWKLDSAPISAGDMMPLHALEEREKREKIEFAQWERQRELGRYIDVTTAGRMAGGEMRQLGEFWRQRNEVEIIEASRKRLIELGVSPEVVGLHTDWLRAEHQKLTDGIEDKVAGQAVKYQEGLKQEIARQQK